MTTETRLLAAVVAVQRGQRGVVASRSGDTRAIQRFRQRLRRCANADDGQLAVMTNAEVVCVAGVDGVEAVVTRYTRTGRLSAVNASAFLSCDR